MSEECSGGEDSETLQHQLLLPPPPQVSIAANRDPSAEKPKHPDFSELRLPNPGFKAKVPKPKAESRWKWEGSWNGLEHRKLLKVGGGEQQLTSPDVEKVLAAAKAAMSPPSASSPTQGSSPSSPPHSKVNSNSPNIQPGSPPGALPPPRPLPHSVKRQPARAATSEKKHPTNAADTRALYLKPRDKVQCCSRHTQLLPRTTNPLQPSTANRGLPPSC